jgi:hypothetical protein
MSEHDNEYRELLAKVAQRDRDSIAAHWELGELFAKYNEPVTDIAMAIERSVTYVADHVRIVQVIPTREDLERVLADRDDIQVWTVLVDWVKAGGPGQESDGEPDANDISRQKRRGQQPGAGSQGGMQLLVPAHIVTRLSSGHSATPTSLLNPDRCAAACCPSASSSPPSSCSQSHSASLRAMSLTTGPSTTRTATPRTAPPMTTEWHSRRYP